MNIIHAVVSMLVFVFIVVISFFAFNPFMDALFTGFLNADFANAESQSNEYIPLYSQVFSLFFSILVAVPVVWFIMWSFRREPRWDYYRRY